MVDDISIHAYVDQQQEGAYADLLLVDGNPLENIDLIGDTAKNFVIIMKDGVIYKNTLQ